MAPGPEFGRSLNPIQTRGRFKKLSTPLPGIGINVNGRQHNPEPFMLKKSFRGPPGGSGRGFQRVLNIHFNIESSWHRVLVDFWWVLGGVGEAKIRFSLRSGYNFDIFGYLKITCLLDP